MQVAFYHKRYQTLLVIDAVTYVPKKPPETINKGALLETTKKGLALRLLSKGKNALNVAIVYNKETQQKGELDDPKSK